MSFDDPLVRCAAGESAWHAAAYTGLGAPWRIDDEIAWAPAGVPHRFLLAAVTLVPRPRVPPELPAGAPGIVCDTWAALTSDDLPGWAPEPADPWMIRPPGRCPTAAAHGVEVERTTDALLFEDTSFRAAGGSAPERRGELHPAGSASVGGLTMFLARWRGEPVGTALAIRHERGVVVSGVAVLETARHRGIGALLTAAARNAAPDVPATLAASRMGLSVYRRLGFEELAPSVHWHPPADAAGEVSRT